MNFTPRASPAKPRSYSKTPVFSYSRVRRSTALIWQSGPGCLGRRIRGKRLTKPSFSHAADAERRIRHRPERTRVPLPAGGCVPRPTPARVRSAPVTTGIPSHLRFNTYSNKPHFSVSSESGYWDFSQARRNAGAERGRMRITSIARSRAYSLFTSDGREP